MNPPPNREVALFSAALELPAEKRASYLDGACADDPVLRQRLEDLLRVHQEAITFLENAKPGAQAPPPVAKAPGATMRVFGPPAEKAGDRIGRYKLLQQIGEGGCGVVYMAEQEEPVRRRVALKVIKLGMDTKQVIARFEAERQALALMDHPNIAKVLEAGATETGRPYFVMELVKGIPITRYCDENCLSTEQRLRLFVQVCQALQHAHQKGIIHRDIKPSNILVADHDGAPVPKVIDFGIAKATTDQRLTDKTLFTAFEQFIGTPAYMSPEQARLSGLDVDTRSDIYSLGVLFYELLTGSTPFDSKALLQAGLDEIRRTIREQEPVRPSTRLSTLAAAELSAVAKQRHAEPAKLGSLIRGDLDWIAMKCLEKDRARRYETASGLAMDIERHLNCEPVIARPPSRFYEFQKTVRRHKFGFAAGAALITLLVVGVSVSTWEAIRAMRSEREQSRLREAAQHAQANEAGLRLTAQTEAKRAEAAAMELKMTLSATDFRQAVRLVDEDNAIDALPFLARSLSSNPTNDAALTRLTTLLTYRSWMRPVLILKHEGKVGSAEFSPDGRRILTSADATGHIWDAETGQQLTPPLEHQFVIVSAHFSPDGRRILTASRDRTARLWDARTGQPLTDPMKHSWWVNSAEFSPDGKRIVTGTMDDRFVVWDVETGKPLFEPVKASNVKTGEVARSSSKGSVHSENAPMKVNNLKTGEVARSSGKGNVYSVNVVGYVNGRDGVTDVGEVSPVSARFSPDGTRILTTASRDHTEHVWDAATGEPVAEAMTNSHIAKVSPDGKPVLRISSDTARVWDAQTGQPLTEPMRHGNGVSSAQFSPDRKRIVTTSPDKTACVWETQTIRPLVEPLSSGGQVRSIQFSHDGKKIATASEDSTARIWDAQTGHPLTEPMKHGGWVNTAVFSPDGKRIVTASRDSTARVWDAETGQPLTEPMQHDLAGRSAEFISAEFSPEGNRIVTASGNTARIWDVRTGRPLTEFLKHGSFVVSAHFSPVGKQIITASWDNTARLWDAQTGQALTEPLKHGGVLGGAVESAEFSPDGKRILTTSGALYTNSDGVFSEKAARVWDAQTGQPRTAPMKHSAKIHAAHFSPDGNQIVTASEDSTARVWDAQTGQPLTEPMKHRAISGLPGAVFSAQFSPDGRRIVTASNDKTARVWDARTGQPLTDPLKHPGSVHAQFSPDGRQIVTASGSVARVWDVAPAPIDYPGWLLTLTEAISGQVLNQQGVLEPTRLNRLESLNQIREQLKQQPGDDDWVIWGRWLLADHATRMISPFSKITVPEYVENRIGEETFDSLDEAEQLAADKPEVLQRISQAREPLTRRAIGRDHAEHGRLAEAAADFARVIELRPGDHEVWHWQAAALVGSGQLDAYRELRHSSVQRFRDTTDPNMAERIAKDFLVLPGSGPDLETAARMAETAVNAPTNHSDMTWFRFAKGLAEYRQGHFAGAAEWMQKVLSHAGADFNRDVEAYMVLAMAHYQTKQSEEAGVTLAKGVEIAEKKLPKLDSGDLGGGWLDWIVAHALKAEAQALIEGRPDTPRNQSKEK